MVGEILQAAPLISLEGFDIYQIRWETNKADNKLGAQIEWDRKRIVSRGNFKNPCEVVHSLCA